MPVKFELQEVFYGYKHSLGVPFRSAAKACGAFVFQKLKRFLQNHIRLLNSTSGFTRNSIKLDGEIAFSAE